MLPLNVTDSNFVILIRQHLLLLLLFCPMASWASSCGIVLSGGTKDMYLEIWYGSNCDETGSIIFTQKRDQSGAFDREDAIQHAVPFENECVFTSLGDDVNAELFCRANGHTPLTGAKYRLKQNGNYTLKCGELGDYPGTPRMQYQCVSGCTEKVPQALDREDPCD